MRRLVALASLAIAASAVATEAEIEISADASFYAVTGNLDHKLDDDEDSSDGFRQKTEFELAARYRDVARALRWGLISTLEGELDGFTWTPKAFVFIQGPPGVSLGLELSRFDEADGSHDSGSILLFSLDAAFLSGIVQPGPRRRSIVCRERLGLAPETEAAPEPYASPRPGAARTDA